jgi:hypothetical protein
MTTHNETVKFLSSQGWVYDRNAGDGFAFNKPSLAEDEWYTIDEALDIEMKEDPDSFYEFELTSNLNSRCATMYSQYMEN